MSRGVTSIAFVALAALAYAAFAACSSFSESSDAPSAPDASDGASAADAGPGADATVDASACPPGAFCDSFERDSVVGDWSAPQTFNGGALAIDPSFATNGSKSLHATTPPRDGTNAARACLELDPRSQDLLDISFDFRFEGVLKRMQVLTIAFAPKSFLLLLFGDDGGHLFAEETFPDAGSDDQFSPLALGPPKSSAWTHYRIVFDRIAKTASVSMDGAPPRMLALTWTPALKLGTLCLGASFGYLDAANVWIDDVVIR